jgi:hypothetical protein
MRIRYIRDWSNGNTNGANNNWNEICAYDYNNTNVALGKTVTPSKAGTNDASVVTDGSDNASFAFSGLGNVTIDLGGIYDIDRIRIRRYFPSGNSTTQYNETKTEVSVNGQDWITVFDCAIEGKYYETSEGKIIKLKKEIDKLEENSSLKDVKDKVIEIENSLQTTKDDFKNALINKGVDCSNIDKMSNLIDKVSNMNIRKFGTGIFKTIYSVPETQYSKTSQYTTRVTYTLNTNDEYIDCVRMTSKARRYYGNDDTSYDFYLGVFINSELVTELIAKGNSYSSDLQKRVVTQLTTLRRGDVIELKTKSSANSGYIEFILEFGYASEDLAD